MYYLMEKLNNNENTVITKKLKKILCEKII
jgi:hypothetical protein